MFKKRNDLINSEFDLLIKAAPVIIIGAIAIAHEIMVIISQL